MVSYPSARIDLTALQHNFNRVKQLASNSRVMSVIKSNAYGHGMVEAAKALTSSDAFAVARLVEGIQLRQAGITQPIVLLEGIASSTELELAAEHELSLVFHHSSQFDFLDKAVLSKPLQFCWLMLETGMNRLGFNQQCAESALTQLQSSANIVGEIGLMSHFANADLVDDDRNKAQLERLISFAEKHQLPTSMANSAALLSNTNSHGDWVRPGIMLYGSSPFNDKTAHALDLKPVMQLSSVISSIQSIKAGEQVGYGGDWIADKDSMMAIVSIGYGDGYSRHLSNTGIASINGQLVPIIGRVSMDMIALDVSLLDNVSVGDVVNLWGDKLVTIDEIAQRANTISYELLCHINQRVVRTYHGQS